MKVDISGEIKNMVLGLTMERPKDRTTFEQDPITGQLKPKETVPMTYKWVIVSAILTPPKADPNSRVPAIVQHKDGFLRYKLAEKVDSAEAEVDLTVDEIQIIRDAVQDCWNDIMICGQVYERLGS